ncbi:uncharacterized protein P884DRAFT_252168 [Thermothelomyces heterothallicus CBS 202.75]|uniref:uncharacterized protein n=1 Tax=Thermothelomyces heterothallicus CBS 202.75 TaxID=1149848 RepID=UPI00374210B6
MESSQDHPLHPAQYGPLSDARQDKAAPLYQQQYQPAAYYVPYQQPQTGETSAPATGPTVLTVTRRVGLTVLGVVVFLLVAAIGLSTGLGVSQRDLRQVKSDLEAAQAVLSSVGALTQGVPDATATTTTTPAAAAATGAAAADDVECPGVNGTFYTASTGGKRFRRLCGIDYGGNGEAVDIGNVKTRNLDRCVDECASRPKCTGAGWGVIQGDEGPLHTCWLKTNLTKPHKATPDWGFAVLLLPDEESDEGDEGDESGGI